jgi:hypothetical protein
MISKNNDFVTDEEAFAIMEKQMKALARRGIVYGRPESKTDDFTEGESILFGPQTELEYRRLTKELKDAENDDD